MKSNNINNFQNNNLCQNCSQQQLSYLEIFVGVPFINVLKEKYLFLLPLHEN